MIGRGGCDTGTLLTFARHSNSKSTMPLNRLPTYETSPSSPEKLPLSLEFLSDLQWLAEHHPDAVRNLEKGVADLVVRFKNIGVIFAFALLA